MNTVVSKRRSVAEPVLPPLVPEADRHDVVAEIKSVFDEARAALWFALDGEVDHAA